MKSSRIVDEYIDAAPKEAQEKLRELRALIKEEIPDAEETISYGVPTFKRHGKYVVYIAGFKKHVSLYPVLESIQKSLPDIATYKSGRGTMQFLLDTPLPVTLIRKVVRLLAEDNLARIKKG